MSDASMSMFNLFVPMTSNTGEAIDPAILDQIRAAICGFAGGYTAIPGGLGEWIAPWGECFQDPVLWISSLVPTGPEAELFFEQLARDLAVQLQQHTIFIYRLAAQINVPDYAD